MAPHANDALANYPLCSLRTVLKRFRPPAGAFAPAGPWEHVYGVYTLAGRSATARRAGVLRLRRKPDDSQARLDVRYEKALTGGSQLVTARLRGPGDSPLATPTRWTFESLLRGPDQSAIPQTRRRRSAAVADGTVTFADETGREQLALAGAYTVGVSLFDAVQRFAPGARAVPFTLIDHYDQLKGDCLLSPGKKMTVTVAGDKAIPTRTVEQFGRGNMPWVYWLDAAGRLLFVVAGLEAYVLEPARPTETPPSPE